MLWITCLPCPMCPIPCPPCFCLCWTHTTEPPSVGRGSCPCLWMSPWFEKVIRVSSYLLPSGLVVTERSIPFYFWWGAMGRLFQGPVLRQRFQFDYSMAHFSGVLEGELDSCAYVIFFSQTSHRLPMSTSSTASYFIAWNRKHFSTFFGSPAVPEWLREGFSSAQDLKISFM